MKKKIGFLIMNIENTGGTERVTSVISNVLSNEGYDVNIISCQNGEYCSFPLNNEVKLFSLHGEKEKRSIIRKISSYKKLKEIILKNNIEIMIAVDVALYLYLFPLRDKCKCIAWEHFNCGIDTSKMASISRKLAVKFADCIVVLSETDLLDYKKKFNKIKRIEYIYNPITIKANSKANVLRKRIIAVGRLEYQKGFDYLIRSWNLLERLYQDWELCIFGEGSQHEYLQNLINEFDLKNIHLKGKTDNVGKELSDSSIFVLSSRFEGFGLVLIEAQSYSLPCVSFDCKSGPSEIIDNGINGYLVQNGNFKQLAKSLEELMKDQELRESFSQNATKDLFRFQEENILPQWEQLFESL